MGISFSRHTKQLIDISSFSFSNRPNNLNSLNFTVQPKIMDNQHSPPRPPTETEDSSSQLDAMGHVRTHTPFESPARAARPPMPSTPRAVQYSVPSTPRNNVYGFAPGTPSGSYSLHHGSKMAVEMSTPVISNANTKFVDDEQGNRKGTPPSQLGIPDGRPLVDKSTSYGVPSSSLAPRTFGSRGPPQPFLKQTNNRPGLGVIKSLAMPSGLYSDDSSLEDGATNESILRPVELKPNRFHSFQGPSQYERKKIIHPITLSPAIEHPNTSPGASNAGQYMPNIRNAHGVKELSDTKDLDAIFKDDRTTPARSNTTLMNAKIVSPMSIDGEDNKREELTSSTELLGSAIPINDRDWSIPSIRLANHVNTFGMDGSIHSYHNLFSDDEDYTDDGGSSYDGSYVDGDDDDDVSLSSKESYDKVRRWRRISGVMRRSQSQASAGEDEDVAMVPPPQVTRTAPAAASDLDGNEDDEIPLAGASLLEQRFGDIAIDNNDQFANPPGPSSTMIFGPPSILNITAQSFDDNAAAAPSQKRRRRRHKKRRAHSHAAIEWIHTLQQTTASEGNQIIEAASSKFLTGAANKTEQSENQDAKALGMPHPLCRSSTIEAGGFAYGVEA